MQTESTYTQVNATNYSRLEERLNALTHLAGLVMAIIGFVALVWKASGSIQVISVSIYGVTLILMFSASTFYHAVSNARLKQYLKVVDHAAIYLLIAGTYTPLMLVTLDNIWGIVGIALIWSLAIFGVIFKLIFHGRFPKLSMATYMVMGWLAVCFIYPLSQNLEAGGLWSLFIGGLSFSVGAIFYMMKSRQFTHAIWHVFVIGGCASHFVTIYYYVI
jgi:hemolysin III